MQLDHPNSVKYFETFEDEYYIHVVFKFIPGENNIFCLICNNQRKITESEMNSITKYLFKAVGFLHNSDIVIETSCLKTLFFLFQASKQCIK